MPETRPFQVGPETLVSVGYSVFDADGELVESSTLDAVFGCGDLLPAVERVIAGLVEGEQRTLELPPEQAYGQRDPQAIIEVDREDFPPDVAPGDCFEAESARGGMVLLQVLEVLDDAVVLDTNHPLAGQKVRIDLVDPGCAPGHGTGDGRGSRAAGTTAGRRPTSGRAWAGATSTLASGAVQALRERAARVGFVAIGPSRCGETT